MPEVQLSEQMKDSTLIFLLVLAGVAAAFIFKKGGGASAASKDAPVPSQGLSLGSILDGWLGRAGIGKGALPVVTAPATSAGANAPAATGAIYNQSNLSGIASLVTAGSGALSNLFNLGSNLFGGRSGDTLPAVAGGATQSNVTVAGGIKGSSLSGSMDMPASIDWGTFA